MHAIEAERIQQTTHIGRERGHRAIAVVGLDLGAAAAAIVGPDDAIALSETVGETAPGLGPPCSTGRRPAPPAHRRLAPRTRCGLRRIVRIFDVGHRGIRSRSLDQGQAPCLAGDARPPRRSRSPGRPWSPWNISRLRKSASRVSRVPSPRVRNRIPRGIFVLVLGRQLAEVDRRAEDQQVEMTEPLAITRIGRPSRRLVRSSW